MTSPSFVLLPGALLPGRSYVFTLNATDPVGTTSADVPLSVARAPRGLRGAPLGTVSAFVSGGVGSTTDGLAFVTVFTISASSWADEDGPLLYQFQYVMNPGGDAAAPAANASALGLPAAAVAAAATPPLAVILSPFSTADTLSGITFPAGLEVREQNISVQLCVPACGRPVVVLHKLLLRTPSSEQPRV